MQWKFLPYIFLSYIHKNGLESFFFLQIVLKLFNIQGSTHWENVPEFLLKWIFSGINAESKFSSLTWKQIFLICGKIFQKNEPGEQKFKVYFEFFFQKSPISKIDNSVTNLHFVAFFKIKDIHT